MSSYFTCNSLLQAFKCWWHIYRAPDSVVLRGMSSLSPCTGHCSVMSWEARACSDLNIEVQGRDLLNLNLLQHLLLQQVLSGPLSPALAKPILLQFRGLLITLQEGSLPLLWVGGCLCILEGRWVAFFPITQVHWAPLLVLRLWCPLEYLPLTFPVFQPKNPAPSSVCPASSYPGCFCSSPYNILESGAVPHLDPLPFLQEGFLSLRHDQLLIARDTFQGPPCERHSLTYRVDKGLLDLLLLSPSIWILSVAWMLTFAA